MFPGDLPQETFPDQAIVEIGVMPRQLPAAQPGIVLPVITHGVGKRRPFFEGNIPEEAVPAHVIVEAGIGKAELAARQPVIMLQIVSQGTVVEGRGRPFRDVL